ncbi:hypothetical protein RND81_09G262500 [Saponaria officinalis]|uniref:Uncharacterized protein n=1 Tax=Saponaria officinalis TaxID=3572 RepID=A0AAW1IS83_SAPOF
MSISSKLLYSIPLISSLLCIPSAAASASDIHDILPEYNIPKGILPNVPNSYSLSKSDGRFTVQLDHPCYVKFDDQLVYYSPVIKGRLSYGKVSHVSGIQARMFFIWVSVSGMDIQNDMVAFHVGAFTQKLPAHQFHTIPSCINNPSSAASF